MFRLWARVEYLGYLWFRAWKIKKLQAIKKTPIKYDPDKRLGLSYSVLR
jgi:hypothetical protein